MPTNRAIGSDKSLTGYPNISGHTALGVAGVGAGKKLKLIEDTNPLKGSSPSCDLTALIMSSTAASHSAPLARVVTASLVKEVPKTPLINFDNHGLPPTVVPV